MRLFAVLMLILVLHALILADDAPALAQEKAPEANASPAAPAESGELNTEMERLKQLIIESNIFRPARTVVTPAAKPAEEADNPLPTENIPRKLRRPFKVMAFDRTNEGDRVYLGFENPNENRPVKVGDVIEFVRIIEINPPFIRCYYEGREVRISAGETSDDAYTRLMGLGSNYHLVGTTVLPDGGFARFYFPREGHYRTVEVGDVLGNARVIAIERGRVHLRQEDGTDFTIKTTTIPQH